MASFYLTPEASSKRHSRWNHGPKLESKSIHADPLARQNRCTAVKSSTLESKSLHLWPSRCHHPINEDAQAEFATAQVGYVSCLVQLSSRQAKANGLFVFCILAVLPATSAHAYNLQVRQARCIAMCLRITAPWLWAHGFQAEPCSNICSKMPCMLSIARLATTGNFISVQHLTY